MISTERRRIVLILAIIVIFLAVAFTAYYLVSHSHSSINIFAPSSASTNNANVILYNITVSGRLSASDPRMNATYLAFSEVGTNATYVAKVQDNQYSVTMPTASSYSYIILWHGPYHWQSGYSEEQYIDLNKNNNITYNINYVVPPSLVTINGNISFVMPNITPDGIKLRSPKNITFSNANGTVFGSASFSTLQHVTCTDKDNDGDGGSDCNADDTTTSSANSTRFSVTVPNLANYTVMIGWYAVYPNVFGSCKVGNTNVQSADSSINMSFEC